MNTYLQLFTGINTTTDNYNSSNNNGNSNGHVNDDSHHSSNEILRKHRLNIFYYNDNELELQHVFLKVLKSYYHNHRSSSSINFSTYLIQLQVILIHMRNYSMKSLIERLDDVISIYDT